MAKKYSVDEIDRMRQLIGWCYPSGISYRSEERAADIENRLRTYMQNGSTVAELEEMQDAHMKREMERHRERQRMSEMVQVAWPDDAR